MVHRQQFAFTIVLFVIFATLSLHTRHAESRYLPTRSNGDRVDKLRELLKELLENEIEKEEYQQQASGGGGGSISVDAPPARWRSHPDTKLFYKREIQEPQLSN